MRRRIAKMARVSIFVTLPIQQLEYPIPPRPSQKVTCGDNPEGPWTSISLYFVFVAGLSAY